MRAHLKQEDGAKKGWFQNRGFATSEMQSWGPSAGQSLLQSSRFWPQKGCCASGTLGAVRIGQGYGSVVEHLLCLQEIPWKSGLGRFPSWAERKIAACNLEELLAHNAELDGARV